MQGTRMSGQAALEPMTGCGILGVLKSIAGMEGVLPLIHGPVSCSSGHRLAMLFAGVEPLLPTTAVEQRHVVLGSASRLLSAMRTAYKTYRPKLLVVILTCATALIGEDFSGVIKIYESETGALAAVIDGSALSGDEVDAAFITYEVLADKLGIRQGEEAPLLALDGLALTDYAFALNHASVKDLIESSLPLTVTPGLFHGANAFEGAPYRTARKARVSLLWQGGMDLAAPVGVEGSLRFVKALAAYGSLDLKPEAMAAYQAHSERLKPLASRIAAARPRVGVEGAGWYAYAMAAFLKNELGCRVLLAVDRALDAIDWRSVADEFYEDTGRYELVELLKAFGAGWVLGSSNVQLDECWRYVPFFNPVWRTVEPVQTLGYGAAIALAQRLCGEAGQ